MKKRMVVERSESNPHPAGTFVAAQYGVEQLGLQPGYSKDPTQPAEPVEKYAHLLETSERFSEGALKGQRRRLVVIATGSLNEKSTLYKLGKALGCDMNGKTFDLNEMIGRSCLVSIRHENKGDRIVTKFDAFAPLPAGVAGITPESAPSDVPKWVRTLQAQALDAFEGPAESDEEGNTSSPVVQ